MARVTSDRYATPACVKPAKLDAFLAFDVLLDQTWNLTALTLGDLSSIIALAPGEQLTHEFQTSQRKVLEQSTMDSTDSVNSTESTTSDKESVNVTRGPSKTQGWHVDTTGMDNQEIRPDRTPLPLRADPSRTTNPHRRRPLTRRPAQGPQHDPLAEQCCTELTRASTQGQTSPTVVEGVASGSSSTAEPLTHGLFARA